MSKRSQKTQKMQTELSEFVIVTLTNDLEQAKDYETLLKDNNIPTTLKKQNDPESNSKGIAVMVPEEFLDEANVVIESQDAYEDFFDLAVEDEDNDGFDSGIFDEDSDL